VVEARRGWHQPHLIDAFVALVHQEGANLCSRA
jgi:hypothetical protein